MFWDPWQKKHVPPAITTRPVGLGGRSSYRPLEQPPKHQVIVGFSGRIGSGKTYAADHLVAKYAFVRKKMAGPLKDMLRAIGLTDEHIEGRLKEKPCDLLCGRTPRHAMQTLGTEWGRNIIAEDLWIRLWEHSIRGLERVVVDDVRFANEADAVRRAGGIVVRLTTVDDLAHKDGEGHASEEVDFEPDFWLFNSRDSKFLPLIDMVALRQRGM